MSRSMLLSQLFNTEVSLTADFANIVVTGLQIDSRQINTGDLFFALGQSVENTQQHIQQAIEKGAVAIVVDDAFAEQIQSNLPIVAVTALAEKCSAIASRFYGEPSKQLKVVAITGTNGKTSVSQFIAGALESTGVRCAVIGTLGCGRFGQFESTGMTTPDPVLCQSLLADYVAQGIDVVVMEASSHALIQSRIAGVAVDIAVFTNLSRDHLDYHQTMTAYAEAKALLFTMPSVSTVVINTAEAFGEQLIERGFNQGVQCVTYQQSHAADWSANNVQSMPSGLQFDLIYSEYQQIIHIPLLGRFNIDNVLATAAVLSELSLPFEQICQAIQTLKSVDGRMERVSDLSAMTVVVDYAHTPDALQQALIAMRQHIKDAAHLWCVFGCGGDRDKGKRSLMGHIASTFSDYIVITDDNPRSEASRDIIKEILSGISHQKHVTIEADRELAIQYAIQHAHEDDMVLVAGKGHETYQERLGVKYPFSDIRVIKNALSVKLQRIEAL